MTTGQWKGVFIVLMLVFISATHAHDGTVNISGTIQDNTCELAPDSQNKTIDMGIFAASQFRQSGDFSAAKKLTLNLQYCGPAASGATVTFSGTADTQNPEMFALEAAAESAKGLALGIYDTDGKPIAPGKSSASVALKPGQTSASLNFLARYVAVQDSVSAGSANGVVTFVVDYD